jgi:purine nucleoside permease
LLVWSWRLGWGAALLLSSLSVGAAEAPLQVKVVIVTMFEIGTDDDAAAGEFQLWKQRRNLSQVYPSGAHHDLHYDPQSGILAMVTGIGTANSAASVMMLGMDPRFDVSKAYWLVAGIAGFDPEDASIGSAAWASYAVDVDLGHEIDPREMPADWPFGYFARETSRPFDPDKPAPTGEMFSLNPELTEWAFQLDSKGFRPNFIVSVNEDDLKAKQKAMGKYVYETREYPHPRSLKALEIFARANGCKYGAEMAEAFEIVRLKV